MRRRAGPRHTRLRSQAPAATRPRRA
jgi:hypothetical protein